MAKGKWLRAQFDNIWLTREEKIALLFLLPMMVLFILFLLTPAFSAVLLAFQNWSLGGVSENKFVGLANYLRMAREARFWNSIRVTLTYAIGLLIIPYMLALPLALFMNMKIKARGLFRTLFFLPVVTPVTAAGLVFVYLFNTDFGIINAGLQAIGIIQEPIGWLGKAATAILATIAMVVWSRAGFNAVTLLSGLQVITKDIKEAALIDGASGWSMFRYITLPLLKPASVVVLTFNLVGAFKMFGAIFVMTGGGPGRATEVLGMYIYRNAFQYWQLGYATAVSTVVFLICLAINAVMSRAGEVDWQ